MKQSFQTESQLQQQLMEDFYPILTHRPLLAMKRCIPVIQPQRVVRPRLTDYLSKEIGHRLTFISAPAGSGKTTLLNEWARQHLDTVAWISLDKKDNNLTRFWRYVIDALKTLLEDIGEYVLPLLYTIQPPSFDSILTMLLNALTGLSDHFTLILDDYHLIDNRVIHKTMTFFLEHLPPYMHVMIASRVHSPLPLARLRASSQLIELQAADLFFTIDETSVFLQKTMGLDLSSEFVAQLQRATDGWIAGLQLAALSLQRGENSSHFTSVFNGNHRYILDYLTEEVFCQQSERIQTFLLHTAILDRLSGPLCDTLMAANDGWVMLERLEQANLFLIPLDAQRQWYRYSQLFRDFLRNRLQRTHPDLVPLLHTLASLWFEQNDLLSEAVDHALAAKDFNRAARLINQVGETLVRNGEVSILSRWLERMPDQFIHLHPRLCLFRSLGYAMNCQLTSAEAWLRYAKNGCENLMSFELPGEAMAEAAPDLSNRHTESGDANLPGEIFTLEMYLAVAQGDISRSIEAATLAFKYLSEHDLLSRSVVTLNLGVAYTLSGEILAATRAFTEASKVSQASGNNYTTLVALCSLALMQSAQGQLHAAIRTYQEGIQLAVGKSRQSLPYASMAFTGLGGILYEQHKLEAATRHLIEGIELSKQWGSKEYIIYGSAILAGVKKVQGNDDEALDLLAQASEQMKGQHLPIWVAPFVSTYHIRLLLMMGKRAAAAQLAEKSVLGEFEYGTWARIHLAQNQPEKALELLAPQIPLLEASKQVRKCIEFRMLQALAYSQLNEIARSLLALQQSLFQAQAEEFIHLFVDEGEPMAALLAKVLEMQRSSSSYQVSTEYIGKLLCILGKHTENHIISNQSGDGSVESSAAVTKYLSEREVELIRLIASGMSNSEIAQQLVLAESTIKWHLKNIYSKLNVHNRTQLLLRARELRLSQ